jgi:hypothetical protein
MKCIIESVLLGNERLLVGVQQTEELLVELNVSVLSIFALAASFFACCINHFVESL